VKGRKKEKTSSLKKKGGDRSTSVILQIVQKRGGGGCGFKHCNQRRKKNRGRRVLGHRNPTHDFHKGPFSEGGPYEVLLSKEK